MRLIFAQPAPWRYRARTAWRHICTAAEYAIGAAFTAGAVWAAAVVLLSLERG